ncbi:hypothetical protein [Jidongwangia harbinensis]|uniref:hypothetical protein n=1 Tax=Jidongwangia harbinensis TaxID=2878561 RepID=UPI001CD963DE|nr:hypothetical protein [Jidongwangia harbinensis]MCA2213221.1 hypothetical protein [Jidongwangia harbinensis]
MSFAFLARTVVAGGYLVAMLLNGRFDAVVAVLACGVALVWAAPLLRDAWCRRHLCADGEAMARHPAH